MRRIIFWGFTFLLSTAFVFGAELERYSGQSEDDGQEASSGTVNTSYTYVELVVDLSRWGGAYRFPDITIPQGATINSAYISLHCFAGDWTHPVITIACEDVDSAGTLAGGSGNDYNISDRWSNRTDATVLWHEETNGSGRDSTHNLNSLVQEIINRPNWKSGNAIVFLFKCEVIEDDRSGYESYSWDKKPDPWEDPDNYYGAILYVDYTPGSAVPDGDTLLLRSAEFLLDQNCPNPFNLKTNITYSLPMASKIKLTIYNPLGKRVRTLIDEYQTPGYKSFDWDGTDDKGNVVASGIYFYQLEAEGFTRTKKSLLLK